MHTINPKSFLLALLLLLPQAGFSQRTLSLDSALRLALTNSRDMQASSKTVEAARMFEKSMYGRYFPRIFADANYLRTNRDMQLLEHDMMAPVIPFEAIDPSTGGLNINKLSPFKPDMQTVNFEYDQTLAEKVFMMQSIGPLKVPLLDDSGKPIFKQYTYIPADHLQLTKHDFFRLGINAVQPIFMGGRIINTHRMARSSAALAAATASVEQEKILFETEEAYWQVVSLQEKVKVVEQYQKMLEQLHADLENLVAEGIILRSDLLRATVKKNELELQHLRATNGVKLAKMDLCQRIGLPTTTDITLTDSLSVDLFLIPEGNHADTAIERRAELRALRSSVELARGAERMMLARFLPDIFAFGGYNWLYPNPYRGMRNEFGGDWTIGVSVHIPILSWGDRWHTQKMARLLRESAEQKLENTQERISLQVQQSLFRIEEASRRVELAHEMVKKAEENLRLAQDRQREGAATTSEVLEAMAQWQDTQSDLLEARRNLTVQALEFRKATGESLHQDVAKTPSRR